MAPDRVPGPGHRPPRQRSPGRLRGRNRPDDHRTAGNRTADALAEIAHKALAPIDRPSGWVYPADPDPRPAGHRARGALAVWAAGIAHRRAHHRLLRETHLRGRIPTDSIHWQPSSRIRAATPPKPNAPPWRYATGPAASIPAAPYPHTAASPTTSDRGDDRGPTDPDQPRTDPPFSPPHSPPRQTRHHPNPHRPLHRHPTNRAPPIGGP